MKLKFNTFKKKILTFIFDVLGGFLLAVKFCYKLECSEYKKLKSDASLCI